MNDSSFSQFISGLTTGFTPVVDAAYTRDMYVPIDLSENNAALAGINISSSADFSVFIDKYLSGEGEEVAYGGYNEIRKLYRRSELFTASAEEEHNRNIHIGLDLWVREKTAVLAALDGKVHSFRDNAAFGDYGPTIILQHEVEQQTFYTLYGHLSRESLRNLSPGMEVKQGDKIAELGDPSENGDYAPHLHFQIIKDLQGKIGDYPGVASRKDISFYLENCPDPDLLLKISPDQS